MASRWMMLGGFLSLFFIPLTTSDALAQDGKDLFQSKCASCHTVGGGDNVGPDLKDVGSKRSADWLVKVITEPDKLAAAKDPAQLELVKKYGMQMPNLGVSAADAQKIVAYLQGGKAAAAAKGEAPAAPGAAAPAAQPAEVTPTPELVATGRDLFTGKKAFSKGGAPCVSCHPFNYPGVYGGALAADLSGIYGSMGNTGIRGVLGSLSFPVMKRVYADRPLSEPETTALLAFFKDASARRQGQYNPYPVAGLGFFAVFIVLAALLKRRIR